MKNYQLFHITCKGLIFHRESVLKRELLEEVGLNLNAINHTIELFALNQRNEIEYGWDDKTQIIEIYYKITIPDSVDLKVKALEEVSGFEWIDKYTNLDNFLYRVASRKNIYKKAQGLLL